MAHINSISSGTFTSLAYIASSTRPANAVAWKAAFDTGTNLGTTVTTAAFTGTGAIRTLTISGTGLPTAVVAGRIYRVSGTGNEAGIYFRAEEVTASTATSWTVCLLYTSPSPRD